MFHLKCLFIALVIFKAVVSLPVQEKIELLDLAYDCIKVETGEEDASKSPILLVHGVGGSNKNWNAVKLLLATQTKRRLCAVDLRNHGDSPWSNRTDVEALAADIGHYLDKHNIEKINFIGHSLGGKVAMHYTLKNPGRVDSIIVEDMRPNTLTQEALSHISALFLLRKAALTFIPDGSSEDDAKNSIGNFIIKKLKEMGSTQESIDQILEFIEIIQVNGKWRYKYNIDAIEEGLKHPERVMTQSRGLYEGPALFIYGTISPFKVNEDETNILKLFPKSQLVPVKGAGHMIHGRFREFNDAVIKFLNKVN